MKVPAAVLCACLLTLFACKKAPLPSPSASQSVPESSPTPATSPQPSPPPPGAARLASLVAQVDGLVALQQARALCQLGPRDFPSPGHTKARAFLVEQLKRSGWSSVAQNFEADTPAGKRTYTNLIATRPSNQKAAARVLLAAHYDAPSSSLVHFPAASSGAAGCGVLLEIAQRLSAFPEWAAQVDLLFFDGEEPVQQFSPTDGLAGSRFYIHSLVENQQTAGISALVVYGSIGHGNARWTLPIMTPNALSQDLRTFALQQKWDAQIADLTRPSWGAHLPALQAGIPAVYLNDALYPGEGTADDSAEQLAAESLRRAAMAGIAVISKALHEAGAPK